MWWIGLLACGAIDTDDGTADTDAAETGTDTDTSPDTDTDTSPDTDSDTDTDTDTDTGPAPSTLIISEVVDAGDIKFVELFNAGTTSASLSGVSLDRYPNGSLTSDSTSLGTAVLLAGESYVLVSATSQVSFEAEFPGVADIYTTVADGNGDDAYVLKRSTSVLDVYGELGVDGTQTPWEYTDQSAKRILGAMGQQTWDPTQWMLTDASTNMSPGIHPDP